MKSKKKNIKQKSFFFEDYAESEIIDNNVKTNQPKVSLNRVTFLFYIFLSVVFIFGIKIIYLSLSSDKNFFFTKYKPKLYKREGRYSRSQRSYSCKKYQHL